MSQELEYHLLLPQDFWIIISSKIEYRSLQLNYPECQLFV